MSTALPGAGAPPARPSLLQGPAARRWTAVAGAYLVGTAAFTWPLVPQLQSHVWGERFDAWTTMWLDWHLSEGVRSGDLAVHTDMIFYPVGYNLLSFGHAALQLLATPLQLLGAGVSTAYNALIVLAFWSTAMAGHLLGRRLSGSHWGGLLAGGLMAFNPHLYGEMSAGCVELVFAVVFPLQAWLLLRFFDAPTWRRVAPVGLVLACTGPFNWYYTLFSGLLILCLLAWRVVVGGAARWPTLLRALTAIGLAALSNLPLIPLVRRETPERPPVSPETFSAENWELFSEISDGAVPLANLDEAQLVVQDSLQVIVNSTVLSDLVRGGFPINPLESTPGMLVYAFGLMGLLAAGRRGFGWAVIAGLFTVLTLGPFLLIDRTPPVPQWSLDHPLPYYYLYNHLPFFSKAYRPYRLGIVVVTCLSALAALGWGRLKWRPRAVVAGAGFALAALWPHWAPGSPATRPMDTAGVPEVYARVRDLPDGAVIELPLQYQPLSVANARFQYHQIVHHKPVLNCNQLIRRTELLQFRDFVGANAFLSTVLDLSRRAPPYQWSGEDLHQLRQQGFRYVIAHPSFEAAAHELHGYGNAPDRLRQPAFQMLREGLGVPLIEDPDAWVFEIPEVAPDQRGAVHTWAGSDFVEISVPEAQLRLPLTLTDESPPLVLARDGAAGRALTWSAWLRPLEGGGILTLQGDPAGKEAPAGEEKPWRFDLVLEPGRWQWVEVPVPPLPADTVWSLEAAGGALTFELDAVQMRLQHDPAEAGP